MQNKKAILSKAIIFLISAIPLLFIAPIVVTIGFKVLKKDNSYLVLLFGILLSIIAIVVTAIGIVKISRYIFDRDVDKN